MHDITDKVRIFLIKDLELKTEMVIICIVVSFQFFPSSD